MEIMGSTQGPVGVPSSHPSSDLVSHKRTSDATPPNLKSGGQKPPSLDNWMSLAFEGSYNLSVASMYNNYADSNELNVAAKLVQKLGSSSQTFAVSVQGAPNSDMTISAMIQEASTFAKQSGQQNASQAGAWQTQAGQAQAEQSQNVQIGQQFTSQETNQSTSVDTQTTNTTTSEMQSLNSALSQWVQLAGPLNA